MIDQLASKISSYHLISYALTGAILILSYGIFHDIPTDQSILVQICAAYACGLAISRIGSLFIEPLLKICKFIRYACYEDYITADKADAKVSALAEQSAFYRTLSTGYACLTALSFIDGKTANHIIARSWQEAAIYFAASVLFALAYRKQNDFVTRRIDVCKDSSESRVD